MMAINIHSYHDHLDKLLDEYNNTYNYSIEKKPIHADYSALSEVIETNHKVPKFKNGDRVRITKYKNILAKVTSEVC